MFSGCGGFDLGAEQSGHARVVWANDSDPAAVSTYRRNFSGKAVLGDKEYFLSGNRVESSVTLCSDAGIDGALPCTVPSGS